MQDSLLCLNLFKTQIMLYVMRFKLLHYVWGMMTILELQVYAYTTSELQVAILKLFVRAECRLPNLFVGTLTRESVTQALEFGVQADQIVTFMQQHAHPHVAHKTPVVPEVCADTDNIVYRFDNTHLIQRLAVC